MYVAYRYSKSLSAFSSQIQQNACYRNTKWTFEELLPCCGYTIKTNTRQLTCNFVNLPLQAKDGTWAVPQQLNSGASKNAYMDPRNGDFLKKIFRNHATCRGRRVARNLIGGGQTTAKSQYLDI